jgi:ATP/maltotriose-dependent transcriptional regulator MalT
LKVVADRQAANPSYVAHATFSLAHIYLSQGNETTANRMLDQVKAYCRESDHITLLPVIQAFEAEFALRRGDIKGAKQSSQRADFDVRKPTWFLYIPQLTPIKWLLAKGSHDGLQEALTTGSFNWRSGCAESIAKVFSSRFWLCSALVCHKLKR